MSDRAADAESPEAAPPAPERPGEPSDRELVDAAIGGRIEAFEQLVERYQKAVFNIAYYKSRNCFDAEDLAQDIFLAAFRALDSLRERDNFSSWLFGIAYNRCHKWFHRERNKVLKFQEIRRRREQEERLARRAPPTEAEDESPVTRALSRLPEDVRQVLVYKYLEGLSYQEIEAKLDIKPHRIDYLIRKGKKAMRELGGGRALRTELR